MSTVDKEFADNIVKHGGFYNGEDDNSLGDNPRVVKIVKYDNAWGGQGYGLIFDGDDPDKYGPTTFVANPITYWAYKPEPEDAPKRMNQETGLWE